MNVFTRDTYFKEQIRRARRLQFAGVICIIVAFLMSTVSAFGISDSAANPVLSLMVYIAYPFLFAGLPLWSIGRSNVKRLSQETRSDQTLNNELKALNNKYSLHHYVTIGDQLVQHLLVTPVGLVVIETSDAVGPVYCRSGNGGDKWRSQTSLMDRVTGRKPAIGNPSKNLDMQTAAVRQLAQQANKPNVPIKGLIVFTRNPELEVEGCSYTALPMNELKQSIRDVIFDMGGETDDTRNIEMLLTSDDRRRINTLLNPQAVAPAPKPAPARR